MSIWIKRPFTNYTMSIIDVTDRNLASVTLILNCRVGLRFTLRHNMLGIKFE